jgi:hypothetical protein
MTTHNLIGIHDCLQTMGDGDDCNIWVKLMAQSRLDNIVRFVICKLTLSDHRNF